MGAYFREEIIRGLGYHFGRGTLISPSTFRAILLTDSVAIADNSSAIDVLKRELKNADNYARVAFAPDGAAWSEPNSRAEFPEANVTIAVTAGATVLNFDGIAVIGSVGTPANGTITSISGDTITLNGHGRANGDAIFATSTDNYPSGLPADSIRYVINAATNTFQLATLPGGSAIALGTSWSGTLTAHYLGTTKLIGWHQLSEAVTLNPSQTRSFVLNFSSDN